MNCLQYCRLSWVLVILSGFSGPLEAQSVAGIYVVQETKVTPGGFYNVIPTAYLLFKDGSIYGNFLVSRYHLDISQSKLSEPKKWGTWKKEVGIITITWGDGDIDQWHKWYVGEPATTGETLDGRFYTVSGGGNVAYGGTITYGSIKTISFNHQGQFTLIEHLEGVNASSDIYNHQTKSGTYSLDRHTIELRYNNGKLEQRAFYFYHGKDNFGIGGIKNVFSPRKK